MSKRPTPKARAKRAPAQEANAYEFIKELAAIVKIMMDPEVVSKYKGQPLREIGDELYHEIRVEKAKLAGKMSTRLQPYGEAFLTILPKVKNDKLFALLLYTMTCTKMEVDSYHNEEGPQQILRINLDEIFKEAERRLDELRNKGKEGGKK